MPEITPVQALENLARLAENAMLNGPDRRLINASIQVLAKLTTPAPDPQVPAV